MTLLECIHWNIPFVKSTWAYYPIPFSNLIYVDHLGSITLNNLIPDRIFDTGDFEASYLQEQVDDYCLPEDTPNTWNSPIFTVNYPYLPEAIYVWGPSSKECTCPTLISGHHRGCPYVAE